MTAFVAVVGPGTLDARFFAGAFFVLGALEGAFAGPAPLALVPVFFASASAFTIGVVVRFRFTLCASSATGLVGTTTFVLDVPSDFARDRTAVSPTFGAARGASFAALREAATTFASPRGLAATGLAATGLAATGLAATGLAATGLVATTDAFVVARDGDAGFGVDAAFFFGGGLALLGVFAATALPDAAAFAAAFLPVDVALAPRRVSSVSFFAATGFAFGSAARARPARVDVGR